MLSVLTVSFSCQFLHHLWLELAVRFPHDVPPNSPWQAGTCYFLLSSVLLCQTHTAKVGRFSLSGTDQAKEKKTTRLFMFVLKELSIKKEEKHPFKMHGSYPSSSFSVAAVMICSVIGPRSPKQMHQTPGALWSRASRLLDLCKRCQEPMCPPHFSTAVRGRRVAFRCVATFVLGYKSHLKAG